MSGYAPSNYAASVASVRVKKPNGGHDVNLSDDMTMAAMSQTNFSKTGMMNYNRESYLIDREPSF